MANYLLFRLYGPMASWGDVAVGFQRPTFPHPSKSAVLGLVAAALGLRREDEESLGALHGGYRFATRVDAAGTLLSDYHTAQSPPAKTLKKGQRFGSRREELAIPRHELSTILSRREYRCDASALVCIWAVREEVPWTLQALAEALRRPKFSLYLGRKSCPPALPFNPTIIAAGDAVEVLRAASFPDQEWLSRTKAIASPTYHWEGEVSGVVPLQTVVRRDDARSRVRWQFVERLEHMAVDVGMNDVSKQD